jgi:twitching motility two-component system response regulator PilG
MLHKTTLHTTEDAVVLSSYQDYPPERKLVIVIDDSQTVRKIVQVCLSREGYAVQGFRDGVEALRWLNEPRSPVPHLMILDIGLPTLDGYHIARYLKSKPRFQHIVILMLTGRDGIVDRLKGRLVGAQTYLTKPFTMQTLISAVEGHIGSPPREAGSILSQREPLSMELQMRSDYSGYRTDLTRFLERHSETVAMLETQRMTTVHPEDEEERRGDHNVSAPGR